MDRTGIVPWLDSNEWLDTTAQAVQQTVGRVFDALGPAGRQVKNVLHGTWLGHPLHPVRHGSRFDLSSGAVIDGPSAFPQPCLEARTRAGQIEVRASQAG